MTAYLNTEITLNVSIEHSGEFSDETILEIFTKCLSSTSVAEGMRYARDHTTEQIIRWNYQVAK